MNALKHISGLIVLTLFWTLLFLTLRIVFIYKYHDQIESYISTLTYGMLGDLSTVGCILGLSTTALLFIKDNHRSKYLKTLSIIIIFLVILIDYSSLLLYGEWGSTLSCRATSYLENSATVWHNAASFLDLHIISYLAIGIIFTTILFRTIDYFFFTPIKTIT